MDNEAPFYPPRHVAAFTSRAQAHGILKREASGKPENHDTVVRLQEFERVCEQAHRLERVQREDA